MLKINGLINEKMSKPRTGYEIFSSDNWAFFKKNDLSSDSTPNTATEISTSFKVASAVYSSLVDYAQLMWTKAPELSSRFIKVLSDMSQPPRFDQGKNPIDLLAYMSPEDRQAFDERNRQWHLQNSQEISTNFSEGYLKKTDLKKPLFSWKVDLLAGYLTTKKNEFEIKYGPTIHQFRDDFKKFSQYAIKEVKKYFIVKSS